MEVSLYSEQPIAAMSEVERLRVVTQLQQKIIGNQKQIIGNLNRQLSAMGIIIEQLHKKIKNS